MSIYEALERGIADIMTFNCGRRPALNEKSVIAMVLNRFEWLA